MKHFATMSYGQRMIAATLVEPEDGIPESPKSVDKWPLFRELCVARKAFGLSDRDLTVLNALLSFHKGKIISADDQLVVFPSNRTLSMRANGMPESTLRRHLAALVSAGVIHRQSSPNGKRYARKTYDGIVALAFGFDLTPLLERSGEIVATADQIRQEDAEYKLLRDQVLLLKRDAIDLSAYGVVQWPDQGWSELQEILMALHKQSRRKMTYEDLEDMKEQLIKLHQRLGQMIPSETEKMSGREAQNERHCETSNKEHLDRITPDIKNPSVVDIPLSIVILATPEMSIYSSDDLSTWEKYHRAADRMVSMIGVSKDVWNEAETVMGSFEASIVVGCILQRISEIKHPNAYVKALISKSKDRAFSPLRMVTTLLNQMPESTKS